MANYRTFVTVTSGGRKLAPGIHAFDPVTGAKLVARGFAKEIEPLPVVAEVAVADVDEVVLQDKAAEVAVAAELDRPARRTSSRSQKPSSENVENGVG